MARSSPPGSSCEAPPTTPLCRVSRLCYPPGTVLQGHQAVATARARRRHRKPRIGRVWPSRRSVRPRPSLPRPGQDAASHRKRRVGGTRRNAGACVSPLPRPGARALSDAAPHRPRHALSWIAKYRRARQRAGRKDEPQAGLAAGTDVAAGPVSPGARARAWAQTQHPRAPALQSTADLLTGTTSSHVRPAAAQCNRTVRRRRPPRPGVGAGRASLCGCGAARPRPWHGTAARLLHGVRVLRAPHSRLLPRGPRPSSWCDTKVMIAFASSLGHRRTPKARERGSAPSRAAAATA